jgi:predicted metalloprotease
MKLGMGGIVLVLVGVFLGPEAAQLLQAVSGGGTSAPSAAEPPKPIPADQDPDRELVEFVNWVHDDLKKVWDQQFEDMGKTYEHAYLVLFTEAVDTGCGRSTSAIGPFYCPPDKKAYIDLTFYRALSKQLGAPGDFAQAYVLAHEIGHHVQNLLGISQRMRQRQKRDPGRKNELSVRLELQADCFAGIWGHSTGRRDLLERGDIEEGLGAASAIGDDRLQKRAGGATNSETWTHGSSAQRVRWFKRGFESGDPAKCDTFSARTL